MYEPRREEEEKTKRLARARRERQEREREREERRKEDNGVEGFRLLSTRGTCLTGSSGCSLPPSRARARRSPYYGPARSNESVRKAPSATAARAPVPVIVDSAGKKVARARNAGDGKCDVNGVGYRFSNSWDGSEPRG